MPLYKNMFVTGCDESNEWMLPWFMSNYKKYNNYPIAFADFGVSKEFKNYVDENFEKVIDMTDVPDKGWFKKPKSMIRAAKFSSNTCWIDTDFEILDNIETLFDWIEPNRLAMVEDKPWTKRRPDMRGLLYYNSGIVAFNGDPQILHQWAYNVEKNPQQGDQETLHAMMESPLSQRVYITDLPNEYNWLRLQLEHDNQDSNRKKAIHWTGTKGKEKIRSKIKQWEK